MNMKKYAHWLHLQWPAGIPESLPEIRADGSTVVPGLFVVGDLTGVPLLKFALDTGARVALRCREELKSIPAGDEDFDIMIVGAGVAGLAAAVELAGSGLRVKILESNRRFSTLVNFPLGKPIYTYPVDMTPAGTLQVKAPSRETLLDELEAQIRELDLPIERASVSHVERSPGGLVVVGNDGQRWSTRRVIVAIGRSGNHRKLGLPGEELPKISNRLHDPKTYTGLDLLVIGGGDSACEAAIACAEAGARTTLACRGESLTRAKPENISKVQRLSAEKRLDLLLSTVPEAISGKTVLLRMPSGKREIPNDAVLSLIGREAPLDFFRRSGVPIRGENSSLRITLLVSFLIFASCLYGWKTLGWFGGVEWLRPASWLAFLQPDHHDPRHLTGVLLRSAASPSFWVTLLYSLTVVVFGIDRMRRRRTAYVRLQTLTLMVLQIFPLFLLPEIILPWLGNNGWIPEMIRSGLFPGDSWWRAYGFILAWPLMAWNVFTEQPYVTWLVISFVQTFVIIPLMVWRWGKGAYCGWVCSCGALAETLGDRHRSRMPHGKTSNRFNFVGQCVLASAVLILGFHILAWIAPGVIAPATVQRVFMAGYWKPVVDWLLAGALGVGLYFWLSGRVWCRFACPLAAWMHICARFSRFRILAEGKKCISCNACTSVCHQGIDIMQFANRDLPMQDPQCVRCSACIQACPTGVLRFGRVDAKGRPVEEAVLNARDIP